MSKETKEQNNDKNNNPKENKKLSFKNRILKLSDKVVKISKDVVETGAKKFQESSIVIDKKEDLDKFIEKSKIYKNSQDKEFDRYVIVIYALKDSSFYKHALYAFPILFTKAWTQNIHIKMCNLSADELKSYKIDSFPSLVLYKNHDIAKVLTGEEKIKKIVKFLNVDINKAIESI